MHSLPLWAAESSLETLADYWLESGPVRTQERRKMATKLNVHKLTQIASTNFLLPLRVKWILLPTSLEVYNMFLWCVCVCLRSCVSL